MFTMQGGRSLEGSQSLNGLVLAMLTGDPFVSRLYLMLIDCSRWQWDLHWFSCWTLSKAAAFKETSSSRVDGCYGLTVQRVNIVTSKLAVQKSSLQVPSLDHSERWHTRTHTMAAMDVLRLFGCCRLIRGKQHVTMTCRVKKKLARPCWVSCFCGYDGWKNVCGMKCSWVCHVPFRSCSVSLYPLWKICCNHLNQGFIITPCFVLWGVFGTQKSDKRLLPKQIHPSDSNGSIWRRICGIYRSCITQDTLGAG